MRSISSEPFCGQTIHRDQINEIAVIVDTFPKLTRTELANTICELFSWKRPTGKLKTVECRQFLERLDARGIIRLPACKIQYTRQTKPTADRTERTDSQSTLSSKLSELSPIVLTRVRNSSQRQLWCEYVDRYHYLGLPDPFWRAAAIFYPIRHRPGKSGVSAIFQSGVADGSQGPLDWLER